MNRVDAAIFTVVIVFLTIFVVVAATVSADGTSTGGSPVVGSPVAVTSTPDEPTRPEPTPNPFVRELPPQESIIVAIPDTGVGTTANNEDPVRAHAGYYANTGICACRMGVRWWKMAWYFHPAGYTVHFWDMTDYYWSRDWVPCFF